MVSCYVLLCILTCSFSWTWRLTYPFILWPLIRICGKKIWTILQTVRWHSVNCEGETVYWILLLKMNDVLFFMERVYKLLVLFELMQSTNFYLCTSACFKVHSVPISIQWQYTHRSWTWALHRGNHIDLFSNEIYI